MTNGDFAIREAKAADIPALLAVYAPYVTDTAVSFEYVVPSAEEFAGRFAKIKENYPYFAAVDSCGTVIGYAYASRFKERAAYAYDAELTVYIGEKHHGMGVGRALYAELESVLRRQRVQNLYAGIAVTSGEATDPYLTDGSLRFHAAMGFREVARYSMAGYKFGRWYGLVYAEKLLGAHEAPPAPFIPYPDLK